MNTFQMLIDDFVDKPKDYVQLQISPQINELDRVLKEYCEEGESPELYQPAHDIFAKIPTVHLCKKGWYFPPFKPSRTRKHRPIKQAELISLYGYLMTQLQQATRTIRQNKKRGITPEVSMDDIEYFIHQAFTNTHDEYYDET
ncbi:hypothetical protein ACFL6U_25590 [Planctomycetota bacterium]